MLEKEEEENGERQEEEKVEKREKEREAVGSHSLTVCCACDDDSLQSLLHPPTSTIHKHIHCFCHLGGHCTDL